MAKSVNKSTTTKSKVPASQSENGSEKKKSRVTKASAKNHTEESTAAAHHSTERTEGRQGKTVKRTGPARTKKATISNKKARPAKKTEPETTGVIKTVKSKIAKAARALADKIRTDDHNADEKA